MSPRILQIAVLVASIAAHAGCSSTNAASDAGASCLANPTLCPAGQTCWPTSSSSFACLPSAAGVAAGASCVEKVDDATCGDGLLCDATNSDGEGQCAAYCQSSASCPSGSTCEATSVAGANGASISICRAAPATTPTDAGPPTVIVLDGGTVLPDAAIAIPDDASTDAGPIKQ